MEFRWSFLDTAKFWVRRYHELTGKTLYADGYDAVDLFNAEAMYRKATDRLSNVYCQHEYSAMDSCPGCDYCEEYDVPIVWTDRN